MNCSLLGSSVHCILQARILEWVAIFSSRASSWPKDETHVSGISCIGRQILYHCVTCEANYYLGIQPKWRLKDYQFYFGLIHGLQ